MSDADHHQYNSRLPLHSLPYVNHEPRTLTCSFVGCVGLEQPQHVGSVERPAVVGRNNSGGGGCIVMVVVEIAVVAVAVAVVAMMAP